LTVLIYGFLGLLAGGFLRVAPFWGITSAGFGWLGQNSPLSWQNAFYFGAAFGLILFVATTLEAISRRSCALWLSMGFFGTLITVAAMMFGHDALRAGDELLRPLFAPLLRDFAAGAWMASGAGLGATLGTLRRLKDLFSERVLALTGGWVGVLLLLYLALQGVVAGR
jgi:hypothetical protein